MIFAVVGLMWLVVALVTGGVLGRSIKLADQRAQHHEGVALDRLEGPLYVADILREHGATPSAR